MGEKVVIRGKLVEGYTPYAQEKIRRHRSHIKMVFDFLIAVQKTDRPSRVMDQRVANLTHQKLKAITNKLMSLGLIEITMIGSRSYSITLTDKGHETIEAGDKFLKFIGEL